MKKKILQLVNRVLKHTDLQRRVENSERRLSRIAHLNHLIIPAILPFQELAEQEFKKVNTNKIYANTDLRISKEDLMFMFWLHNVSSLEQALAGYFSSGLSQADTIKALIASHYNDTEKIQVLDFASGHGRVSRYFKNFLSPEQITVADIKSSAVLFQKNIFGYDVFAAPANPLDLTCNKKFDLIVVGSLFTHLNEDLFSKWIKTLSSLLTDKGMLSVSLHILEENSGREFIYTEISEDDLFPEISESLGGKNIYGMTSLTRNRFYSIVAKNIGFNYKIVGEEDWAGSQRLISIKQLAN